jgi:Na+/H+-translocating membrane pyrophosphatase
MSELPKEVRTRTDILMPGNTTAATGFAIASAALTSLFICCLCNPRIDGIYSKRQFWQCFCWWNDFP